MRSASPPSRERRDHADRPLRIGLRLYDGCKEYRTEHEDGHQSEEPLETNHNTFLKDHLFSTLVTPTFPGPLED